MMAKKVVPVEKNEYYDVTIESLTHDGLGVARVDGFPVFVADALVGEEMLGMPVVFRLEIDVEFGDVSKAESM